MIIKNFIGFALNLLLFCVICKCDEDTKVQTAFKTNEIVPDIISEAPKHLITVKYSANKVVDLGKELKPAEVKQIPEVQYEADSDDFYTLILTDPDAPSRKDPKRREFQHWIVTNIPGGEVKKGETLTEYVGSGPPKDTGLHRYVFLLYKQPKKLQFDEPRRNNRDGRTRALFSTKKFAEKYGLGQPVAGNFYQAQFDDTVPSLHKQLGF